MRMHFTHPVLPEDRGEHTRTPSCSWTVPFREDQARPKFRHTYSPKVRTVNFAAAGWSLPPMLNTFQVDVGRSMLGAVRNHYVAQASIFAERRLLRLPSEGQCLGQWGLWVEKPGARDQALGIHAIKSDPDPSHQAVVRARQDSDASLRHARFKELP